jgi:pyrroline-5-carboxylate reductase
MKNLKTLSPDALKNAAQIAIRNIGEALLKESSALSTAVTDAVPTFAKTHLPPEPYHAIPKRGAVAALPTVGSLQTGSIGRQYVTSPTGPNPAARVLQNLDQTRMYSTDPHKSALGAMIGVIKKSIIEAVEDIAKEQNHPTYQQVAAVCYDKGILCEEDKEKAFKYYKILADEHSLYDSQLRIGLSYLTGSGVKMDSKKAFEYFQKAASNEYRVGGMAYISLGKCYYSGIGVDGNVVKAYEFFDKAKEEIASSADKEAIQGFIDRGAIPNIFSEKQKSDDVERERVFLLLLKEMAKRKEDRKEQEKKKILVIGNGKMAKPLIAEFAKSGIECVVVSPNSTTVPDGVRHYKSSEELESSGSDLNFDAVFLAVKPQKLDEAVSGKYQKVKTPLVVSILAGTKISTIKSHFPGANVLRTMPNTPAQIGLGVTGIVASEGATEQQKQFVGKMFDTVGKSIQVKDEDFINRFTAVSGSYPAFLYYLMEISVDAMVEGGATKENALKSVIENTVKIAESARGCDAKKIQELRDAAVSSGDEYAVFMYDAMKSFVDAAKSLGFSEEDACKIVTNNTFGVAKLAEMNRSTSLQTLRENVTSKGGTTAAGLKVMTDLPKDADKDSVIGDGKTMREVAKSYLSSAQTPPNSEMSAIIQKTFEAAYNRATELSAVIPGATTTPQAAATAAIAQEKLLGKR